VERSAHGDSEYVDGHARATRRARAPCLMHPRASEHGLDDDPCHTVRKPSERPLSLSAVRARSRSGRARSGRHVTNELMSHNMGTDACAAAGEPTSSQASACYPQRHPYKSTWMGLQSRSCAT